VKNILIVLAVSGLLASTTYADSIEIVGGTDRQSAGLPIREVSQHPVALFQNGAAQTGGDLLFLLWPKADGSFLDDSDPDNSHEIVANPSTLTLSTYDQETLTNYCAGGHGLTELQWRSVYSSDIATLSDLWDFSRCNPPSYSYQDYLAAFKQYCTGTEFTELSDSHQFVILKSGKKNYPSLSIETCKIEK